MCVCVCVYIYIYMCVCVCVCVCVCDYNEKTESRSEGGWRKKKANGIIIEKLTLLRHRATSILSMYLAHDMIAYLEETF